MRTDDFVAFILEREAVRVRKASGASKPWTTDKILQRFRFCNVRREDDKVTLWIAQNWRKPLTEADDPNLWFWMLVARLVNHPDTLLRLQAHMRHAKTGKWEWKPAQFIRTIESLQFHGAKAWGGAYIVSTNGHKMNKAEYIAKFVLTPAWAKRKLVTPKIGDSLAVFCGILMSLNGVQGFIAGQVIADAKYASNILKQTSDWHTFAISGPGSKRGLNRIVGRDKGTTWKESAWLKTLQQLRDEVNKRVHKRIGELHAQDVQNCLCEFDKYERVRLGEGKPRSTYPGV